MPLLRDVLTGTVGLYHCGKSLRTITTDSSMHAQPWRRFSSLFKNCRTLLVCYDSVSSRQLGNSIYCVTVSSIEQVCVRNMLLKYSLQLQSCVVLYNATTV